MSPLPIPTSDQLVASTYVGWAWRGAHLSRAGLALYTPGSILKHLGCATARTDAPQAFPVLFRIRVHRAWIAADDGEEIVFPPDTCFRVKNVVLKTDTLTVVSLEQIAADHTPLLAPPIVLDNWPDPKSLLQPTPECQETWMTPFACWGRDAGTRDHPLSYAGHTPSKALEGVVSATGVAQERVAPVLRAMDQYEAMPYPWEAVPDTDLPSGADDTDAMDFQMRFLRRTTGETTEVLNAIREAELEYRASLWPVDDLPSSTLPSDRVAPPNSPPFPSDLDHALWVVEWLFHSEGIRPQVITRKAEGALLAFTFGGDRFVTHVGVTRRTEPRAGLPLAPEELTEACREHHAIPLRLHVDLEAEDDHRLHTCHGESAFRAALRQDADRWKRHMLGGLDIQEWVSRAGGISSLAICTADSNWPYASVDGEPPRLPHEETWNHTNPPIDPWALCRSVTTDDECWLFTCECGERGCAGINFGILVAHSQGLVLWRSRERPEIPIAVFEARPYRRVVLRAMKALLRTTAFTSSLNWTQSVRPRSLRRAIRMARKGWSKP